MPDDADRGADDLIARRFRVSALLGDGATATVYEAFDTETGGTVALKVLDERLARSADARRAFVAEAATVAGVRHDALAGVVGAGEQGDGDGAIAWTAWERAPGRSLAEEVRAGGPLDPALALTIGIELLGGLGALHAAGLCHRDVSPTNIVVDRSLDGDLRSVRLIDFGLVGAIGDSTRGGDLLLSASVPGERRVVGNVHFAPPELLRGEGVGAAGDLYELAGCLIFAMTGDSPFPRASHDEILRAHRHALPPTLSRRGVAVGPAIDRAIVRALLKDPDSRFTSADEMAAALRAGLPATVEPATSVLAPPTRAIVAASLPAAEADEPGRTRILRADDAPPPVETAIADERGQGAMWGWWILGAAVVAALVAGFAIFGAPASAPVAGETSEPAPTVEATSAPSAPPPPEPPAPEEQPAVTVVPALTGMTIDAARAELEARGLVVSGVQEDNSRFPRGTVLRTDPAAESELPEGSSVVLVAATGSQTVPDLDGVSTEAARESLTAAGFTPVVVETATDAAPPGTVLATRPDPGAVLLVGTSVVLEVAVRPVPAAPTPTPTVTPGPVPTPGEGGDEG